jgi:hypothetical protein
VQNFRVNASLLISCHLNCTIHAQPAACEPGKQATATPSSSRRSHVVGGDSPIESAATAIWDASIAKIVLGGASGSRDLLDLSTLIGDRDETTDSVTIGERGLRSNQRSTRRVPIMPPDVIRTLPYGTALVLLRSAPPIVTRMREWTARPDAAELSAQRAGVERLLRRG